jgi:uncharacterized protein
MSRFSTSHKQCVLLRPTLWLGLIVLGFLLASALPASTQNGYPPRSDLYINDFAKVIDAEDASNLRQALSELKSSKGIELAVVTVNSIKDYPTGDATFEAFATHLFNTWGIGDAKRNDGVMLLIAVKDHKLRVELGKSYGSGHSTEMQSIIDNTIVPDFKQGAYSRGIYRGVKAIVDQLDGGKQTQLASAPPQPLNATTGSTQSRSPLENLILIIVFGLIVALIGGTYAADRRLAPQCRKCKSRMIHLDDNTKLTHLDAGQQREQAIKSVEYDVWLCPTCGATIVKINLLSSIYISCPNAIMRLCSSWIVLKDGPPRFTQG